ncbi:IS3 family transposase [Amphibacillus sp. MSJ-3]|uniref:IS3 family transposase n=1 Tax=Amphibacillus sp. MSJ-3 TaxID=2841505 RepID=UPI003530028F
MYKIRDLKKLPQLLDTIESFIEQLDKCLVWYNNERIKQPLGGMSIVEHRKMINFAP